MNNENQLPSLISLPYISYIDDHGNLSESLQGKIGAYAILIKKKYCNLLVTPAISI